MTEWKLLPFDVWYPIVANFEKTLKNNFDFNWPFNLKCLTNFLSTLFFWNWQVLITLWTITIFQKRILIPKPKSFLARNYQRMSKKNWIFNIQIPQWHPQNSTGLFFTWPFNSNCLTNFLSTLFLWSWWVLITLRTTDYGRPERK